MHPMQALHALAAGTHGPWSISSPRVVIFCTVRTYGTIDRSSSTRVYDEVRTVQYSRTHARQMYTVARRVASLYHSMIPLLASSQRATVQAKKKTLSGLRHIVQCTTSDQRQRRVPTSTSTCTVHRVAHTRTAICMPLPRDDRRTPPRHAPPAEFQTSKTPPHPTNI